MKLILMSLLATLTSTFAFAMTVPEARVATAQVVPQTDLLIGTCDKIGPDAEKIKFELSTIAAGLNEFTQATDTALEDALKDLDRAIHAVDMSLVECINYNDYATTNGKDLLDMYLLHIDIDLMILEHGVGPDLNRKK